MSATVKIMCSIGGFTGQPITLLAGYDQSTGLLLVTSEVPFKNERRDGFAFLTNSAFAESRDGLFSDANFEEAMMRFRELRAAGLLDLAEKLRKHDPDARIDVRDVTDGGRTYRVSAEISNGQVAVLALTWFAARQRAISAAESMTSDLLGYFDCETI
jgi:hypothetical protein